MMTVRNHKVRKLKKKKCPVCSRKFLGDNIPFNSLQRISIALETDFCRIRPIAKRYQSLLYASCYAQSTASTDLFCEAN